mmetsp:Transcript_82144/g.237432  ORF Transcript_82144/g.237432 Transcript_82144/m.237432 type:complete len:93 (+) Transcript_82144:963-1241(+)
MYRIQTCSKVNNVLLCKRNMEVTHPLNNDKGQVEPIRLAPEVHKAVPRVVTPTEEDHHKAVVRLNNNNNNNNEVLHPNNKRGHVSILGHIQA